MGSEAIPRLKVRLAVGIFLILAYVLYSFSFLVNIFNPYLDEIQLSVKLRILERVGNPSVFVLYLVFVIVSIVVLFSVLKPLFNYFRTGENYEAARKATGKISFWIILVVMVMWITAFTLFYALQDWQLVNRLPYSWALFLSTCSSFYGANLLITYANFNLFPLKEQLQMHSIHSDEKIDFYTEKKEYFILTSSLLHLVSISVYIMYVFANSGQQTVLTSFQRSGVGFLLLFLSIAGGFIMLLFAKREDRFQMENLYDKVRSLSEGNGDLTQRLLLLNFNSVGRISSELNHFIDTLNVNMWQVKDAVSHVGSQSNELNSASQLLAAGSEEQAAQTMQMGKSIESFAKEMLSIREAMDKQNEIVSESRDNLSQMAEGISEVLAKFTHILSNAKASLEDAQSGQLQVANSALNIRELSGNMSEISKRIQEAHEETKGIDVILKAIKDIAEQTNILAMNAAIEAAHAGDAGRGFAIVAEEVRGLAAMSAASVSDIKSKLSNIRTSIERTVSIVEVGEANSGETEKLASGASDSIHVVEEKIRELTALIQSVSEQTNQQAEFTQTFTSKMNEVLEFISSVKKAVEEQSHGAEEIIESISALNQTFTQSLDSAGHLSESAGMLQSEGKKLSRIVGQFKLDESSAERLSSSLQLKE